jgi:DNA invertase Pin-like site-specific DNA recombinase
VPEDRIYLDKGLTGTSRARPGLDQAAVRAGDTLVVPKLDRLARSVPDARDIGGTLAARSVRLSLGGSIYDPADPMSEMFFTMLAVFAEFEAGLLRMRTCEGMAIARSRGRLKGKKPKLAARQQAELVLAAVPLRRPPCGAGPAPQRTSNTGRSAVARGPALGSTKGSLPEFRHEAYRHCPAAAYTRVVTRRHVRGRGDSPARGPGPVASPAAPGG